MLESTSAKEQAVCTARADTIPTNTATTTNTQEQNTDTQHPSSAAINNKHTEYQITSTEH